MKKPFCVAETVAFSQSNSQIISSFVYIGVLKYHDHLTCTDINLLVKICPKKFIEWTTHLLHKHKKMLAQ